MYTPAIKYIILKSKVISAHTSSPHLTCWAAICVCLQHCLAVHFMMVGNAGLCPTSCLDISGWEQELGHNGSSGKQWKLINSTN